ncbi:MAG: TetR family transcriptional regulator [Alphaproteobacteria bacterium]|nr:TetR family transcriptional regulator [Alphaproteobacteria bacterium]
MSPPLPHFEARPGREQAALEASRAVLALFLAQRSADFSVKALAEHTGLSERTFYRYFPHKEDAVRPYIEAGLEHVVAALRAVPRDRPLREALTEAHAELLDLGLVVDVGAFLAVLSSTERLRALWLSVATDAEAAFAEVVAERLGVAPDALQARIAGGVIVLAGRLALQSAGAAPDGHSPSQVFADCLDQLGPGLFEAPAAGHPEQTPDRS